MLLISTNMKIIFFTKKEDRGDYHCIKIILVIMSSTRGIHIIKSRKM